MNIYIRALHTGKFKMQSVVTLIDLRVILIFFSVFLVCYFYLSKRRRNLPPNPSNFPLFGGLLWFNSLSKTKKHVGRALYEESQALGNVISLKLGSQLLVYIHGYDLIHETFVKQGRTFSDRPNWLPHLKESLAEGKGMLWQNGHPWKVMRRFTLEAFRDFGVGKTSLEEKIMVEVEAATDFFTGSEGNAVTVRHLTSMMIANVIYGIVFGKRFEYGDEQFDDIIERLDSLFRINPRSAYSSFGLFLMKWFRKDEYNRRLTAQKNSDWVKAHIKSSIMDHELSYESENIRDFVDLYIQAKQEDTGSEEPLHSFGNIFRLIMDLFIAGSETTSNTINWSILYAMEYPDVQARCQQQITDACGDREITYSDRKSLPYIEATLMEIQRLANIAHLSLPHTTLEDTTVGGFFVPAHTIVHANLYSSHMDPKYWDQPEVFNLDRFLDDEGKLKKNPAFMPFSTGPRACVGESLAKMEIFLIFTNLLSRFTFTRNNDSQKNSFERDPIQLTSAPLPYKTRALRRTV